MGLEQNVSNNILIRFPLSLVLPVENKLKQNKTKQNKTKPNKQTNKQTKTNKQKQKQQQKKNQINKQKAGLMFAHHQTRNVFFIVKGTHEVLT